MKNYSVKYKKQIADMKYFLEAYYDTYAINYANAKQINAFLRTENDEHIVLTIIFSDNGIMGGITKPIDFTNTRNGLRVRTLFLMMASTISMQDPLSFWIMTIATKPLRRR